MAGAHQIAPTGFRFVTLPGLVSQRVVHGAKDWPSLAILDAEDDGSFTLFPTAWDDLPAPLTGETTRFADLAEVHAFLGIKPAGAAA